MRIEHVALWVDDIENMRRFYEIYFDAQSNAKYENEKKQFESYFLTFRGSRCRLELMHRPKLERNPREATGYAHLAFSLGSKQAVDALTERFQLDGYTHMDGPRTTGDGYYESVILDPEGNIIELTI
ncbi:VOC family protein [Exiguobacterium sp. s162]|uniref:VOC family protein n=1 Tax=Exiguobacterium sp. s162 TaxID=2751276 RepID=UPI001BE65D13|nr:VOC family protein [Exiguobacterium sp. s162]